MDDVLKLFRHAAVYGMGQMIGKVVAFLLIPLFTYYLSRTDFGTMEVLNQANTLIGMALGLGVANAVMRYYYAAGGEHERRAIVGTGMVFGLAMGGLVLVTAWFVTGPIGQLLLGNSTSTTLVRLAAVTLLFTFCADIGWTYLQATQRSVLYVTLSQGFLLLSVALNIYFVVIRKAGVLGVFWSSALASAIITIILLTITIRNVGVHFSAKAMVQLLRFGVPLTPAWIAAFVMNFSDRFFLQRFQGLSEVGIYAVGYKFGFIVSLLIVQPFIMIWEPKSYEIADKPNPRQIFRRMFSVYSTLLILVGLCISVPIREVFDVMVDHKFLGAYLLVPIIAFAYVAQGLGRFSEAAFLVTKKTHVLGSIGTASAAFCLLANFLLIRRYGVWGGAVSTLATFVLFAVISYRWGQKYYPIEYDLRTFMKVSIVAGIVLASAFLVPDTWTLPLRVLLKSLLLLLFVCSLPRLGVLTREEMHTLRESLKARVRRKPALAAESILVSHGE